MRITATFLMSAAIAVLALTAFTVFALDTAHSAPLVAGENVQATACSTEAAAYTEVAGLAFSYGESGDLFDDALHDLREQLFDCLAAAGDQPEDGVVVPSADEGWSI